MPAGGLIERRDAHETMDAGLGRHQAESILTTEREGDALEPGLFARLILEHLALEAAALGPLQVHAQQHLCPVLRLDTTGAGVNGNDGVGEVVLAAQHLLGFSGFDLQVQGIERASQVGEHVFPAPGPLEQHADVVGFGGQAGAKLDVLRQAALALQRLLCVGLVVPEIRGRDLPFELR